ncbi:HAD-IIA family hydrolase [Paenibacillus beijingensis]|uniref:Acid sugar phosphatase n=1 Tax=Paenibacillus beijingensis TaxID=1126833 RepID=A0A0D5NRB7_9BACL|nr:HAD-IIA family hydrolase [Paenibacillus beijingensis]AJY77680.1 haloacid dehalogenase [Paenibacillus beijingensis]
MTSFDAYCFDLDGTIFVGDTLLADVQQTISELRGRGKKILFLTNTSVQTRQDCQKRLARMKLFCSIEEILTALYVTGLYFKENVPHARLLLLGEAAMEEELRQFELQTTDDPLDATHVLVGMDRHFTYDKLKRGMTAIRGGAKLVAVNPDPVCPVPGGFIPDTWPIVKALEAAGGVRAHLVIGKPSVNMAKLALRRLGVSGGRCLMVGDRLDTDVLMGLNGGMQTALVLTGVAAKEDIVRMDITPHYVIDTLAELIAPKPAVTLE